MKILMTGAGGLLGQSLWPALTKEHEVWAAGRHKPSFVETARWRTVDITRDAETYSAITRLNPEVVIHAAALSNVDACERSPEEAFRVNALGTRNVAAACQRFDALLIHLSTNYVFGAEPCPPEGYREFDATGPVNAYGRSKKWAEDFVQALAPRFIIVRSANFFGTEGRCFALEIVNAAREGRPVKATPDWQSSVTYTEELAGAVAALVESRLYGVVHLTNAGISSRWEFASHLASLLKPLAGFKVIPAKSEELRLAGPRPSCAALQNLHWTLSGRVPLRPWKEALKDFAEKAWGRKAAR